MPEPVALEIDVAAWVDRVRDDPVAHRLRQATEITLNAIAMAAPLNERLYLKGGVLMGLAYDSPRQTSDIDLTADLLLEEGTGEWIRELLDVALPRAAVRLGYDRLVAAVHSVVRLPKRARHEDVRFPALKVKIASAERGTSQERALRAGRATNIIDVDISFNELTHSVQILDLTGGRSLRAYGLVDLVAEKYRAMLQQVVRNRNRRQDVYDLHRLITRGELAEVDQRELRDVIVSKCASRDLEATRCALDHPGVRDRAAREWDTLRLELGELPAFEECFEVVTGFYRGLPWSE